jgi:hypothetical protein
VYKAADLLIYTVTGWRARPAGTRPWRSWLSNTSPPRNCLRIDYFKKERNIDTVIQ